VHGSFSATRIAFILNPTIKEWENVSSVVTELLVQKFQVCEIGVLKLYLGIKSSSAQKALTSSERMMKTYVRWQQDLFQTLWNMFVIGSPSHTLRAFDFYQVPYFNGKICPSIGSWGSVQGKRYVMGFQCK
jgi:hypothetical protein